MRNRDEATRQRRQCARGAIAVLAVLIGLTAPVVYAAIPDANGVIHGCYNANNGNTRIIDTATSSCRNPEVAVQWGQQGPSGPAGQTGPQGAQGPAGPQGPAGTALAYAHVLADGTLDPDQSSANITVKRHYRVDENGNAVQPLEIDAGLYCIGVTGGTAGMVHVAVVSLDSHPNVGGTVQASVFLASGCDATNPTGATGALDGNDIYVVTRPQLQDGGQNGIDRAFYLIVN
jgi:hypothetical protein